MSPPPVIMAWAGNHVMSGIGSAERDFASYHELILLSLSLCLIGLVVVDLLLERLCLNELHHLAVLLL